MSLFDKYREWREREKERKFVEEAIAFGAGIAADPKRYPSAGASLNGKDIPLKPAFDPQTPANDEEPPKRVT